MSGIKLTTPEGYFHKSLDRTLATAAGIGRRRKLALYTCAALVLILGSLYSIFTVNNIKTEKEYLAWQAEMAGLDIFLEINR